MERLSRSPSRPTSSTLYSGIGSGIMYTNYPISQPPTIRILETRLDDHPEIQDDQDDEPEEQQLQHQDQELHPPSIPLPMPPEQNYPFPMSNVMDEDQNFPEPESQSFMDADQYMMMPPLHYEQEIGIYGWRKKILYIFLIINVVLVGINFALAFWIISVLGFASTGIGGIDLSPPDLPDQIKFKGSAVFEKLLFAKEVHSYPAREPLKFTSKNGNITFRSLWSLDDDPDSNQTETKIILTKDLVQIFTNHFEIYDRKERLMFALDSFEKSNTTSSANSSQKFNQTTNDNSIQQLTLRTNGIKINGINSLTLPLSLQTTLIENSINDELKLFSPQGRLLLRGPKSVHLESKAGQTSVITYDDLILKSNGGKIILDADSILMRRLMLAIDDETSNTTAGNRGFSRQFSRIEDYIEKPDIYQMCICSDSGKLFLAKPDTLCSIDSYRDCR